MTAGSAIVGIPHGFHLLKDYCSMDVFDPQTAVSRSISLDTVADVITLKFDYLSSLAVILALLSSIGLSAHAQGTAFTYQGRLNSGSTPVGTLCVRARASD